MKFIKIQGDDTPSYYHPVLVCYGGGYYAVAWRANDGDNDIYTIHKTDVIINDVVSWCELPE